MAINSEIKMKEISYPCLRYYDSCGDFFVALFSREGEGMVLQSNIEEKPVGHYSDRFIMSQFKVFHGKLELSNE